MDIVCPGSTHCPSLGEPIAQRVQLPKTRLGGPAATQRFAGPAGSDLRPRGVGLQAETTGTIAKVHAVELIVDLLIIALVAFPIVAMFWLLSTRSPIRRVTINEWERALRYDQGRFQGLVQPGEYWYVSSRTTFVRIDSRLQYATVPGQEILTSDSISIKISLAATYEVSDPVRAFTSVTNYTEAMYLELQIALRELAAGLTIDELLAQRGRLGATLLTQVQAKAGEFGVKLKSVSVKDVMFPGNLRDTFAKVVAAQKEGLATLERARSESAALRHLANAAQMIEKNPALLQLRLLQSIGESSGNTLVLGAPSDAIMKGARPDSEKDSGKKKKNDR